jgi:hypothetical protein
MTRKDYVLLAEALQVTAYALNPPERTGALLAANEIAHRLKQDNPRFDRKRFLEAAGLDPDWNEWTPW